MKKLLFISTLLLISFLQFSCSTEGITNSSPTTNPVDVYVAGSKDGQACYWKNGQIVLLDSGNDTGVSAGKIIVSNNNVYVIGTSTLIDKNYFWKNGVLSDLKTQLNETNSPYFKINDMDVVADDIYFVGSYGSDFPYYQKTAYWKNNVKTILEDGLTFYRGATIKVLNNSVYVGLGGSGYYFNSTFYNESVYFVPRGFAANGNNVYLIGSNQNSDFYRNLTTGLETNFSATIQNIFFDNNNIYYSTINEIYKNETLVYSVNSIDDNIQNFKILNDNLYVIESINPMVNNNKGVLKINNLITMTSSTNENFNTLFIVQN
jgi:hypothetical protein